METFFYSLYVFLGLYFLIAFLCNFLTLALGLMVIIKRKRQTRDLDLKIKAFLDSPKKPKVTIIIPAFNEEVIISGTVRTYMNIYYPDLEVILIDDGSNDRTTSLLVDEFKMIPYFLRREGLISNARIKETFQSTLYPQLRLIQQENRGKAGALNTGIDFAAGELIITADADTIPEEDSVFRLVMAYLEDPQHIKGVSGTVKILNGARYKAGTPVRGRLPRRSLILFQVLEYIRVFYTGRVGRDHLKSTILLSGAFTLFEKKALTEISGFNEKSITEDFEITVRMLRHFMVRGKFITFRLLPDPICWTQAPESLSDLRCQRIRWQKGLVETLKNNIQMLFKPKYGPAAMISLPYMLVFEWFGPYAELLGYFAIGSCLWRGHFGTEVVLGMLAFAFLHSIMVNIISIAIDQYFFIRRHSIRDFFVYFFVTLYKTIGYRQLTWFWRLEAMLRMPFEKNVWGPHERQPLKPLEPKEEEEALKEIG